MPASPSDSHTKSKVGKRFFPPIEEYILLLHDYLSKGNFIYSFATKWSSLAPSTVTSYCSFVRKFLEAIYHGMTPHADLPATHAGDNAGAAEDKISIQVLLLNSIRLQHISTFVSGLCNDDFKACTAVNYMSAILWHLTYLKYLTHPNLNTANWTATRCQLWEVFCPDLATKKKVLEWQPTELHQHLYHQIGTMSDEATQQTKACNSGEALQL